MEHLTLIDKDANETLEHHINKLAKAEGIDEKLKENNETEWVQAMNNIKNRAVEIVLKEIDVALHAGRDHARINLISAKEIEEILKECMVREERLKRMFENAVKETDENVCLLDKNLSPVFVEKEHPETEMLEEEHLKMLNEIEHLRKVIEDKDKELEELRKRLGYMKEAISDKNKCIVNLEKENKELREKYKALTDVHYVGKEECYEEEQNDCDIVALPSCYGNFDLANINCLECEEKVYCLSEKEKQTKEEKTNA